MVAVRPGSGRLSGGGLVGEPSAEAATARLGSNGERELAGVLQGETAELVDPRPEARGSAVLEPQLRRLVERILAVLVTAGAADGLDDLVLLQRVH